MVTIRLADLADAAAVGGLTHSVYVGEGYVDQEAAPDYAAELANASRRICEAQVFVAMADDVLVGSVTAATAGTAMSDIAQPGELEIRMLAVVPLARSQGVASALVSACEQLAAARRCEGVVLSTDPKMATAQRLYERRGYVRTPQRDWAPHTVPLLTYRLDLPR